MDSLDTIMETMSLEECCSSLSDSANPIHKFASIVTLAAKFKDSESLDQTQADTVLASLPADLIVELLSEAGDDLSGYQRLGHHVSSTLLTLCGDGAYFSRVDLVLANLRFINRKPLKNEDVSTVLRLFRPPVAADQDVTETASLSLAIVARFLAEEVKTLPELDHLQVVVTLLKLLDSPLPQAAEKVPEHLRLVISRILHSPPQRLDDAYRKASFEIIRELCVLFNAGWLEPEPKLLCLIAHLVSAQLRIVLDDPKKIDVSQLITCLAIAETCIHSIEEEDFVDDDTALLISKAARDGAVFIIEYWGQAKELKEELPLEVECALYRFVCVFLAIGGARIAVESDLKKICPHLLRVAWVAIENKEPAMVSHIISVLDEVPVLEKNVPLLLTSFIELDEGKKKENLEKVIAVVEALSTRADWYDRDSLAEAVFHAQKSGYSDLYNALKSV